MKPPEIRERLEQSGRSQRALAAHLGISKDSMSRLLLDKRNMEVTELERIKEFFEGDQAEATPQFVQIPVYGYAAAGGDDRISIADDRVIDRIEVPAGLVRGEAMAIRVAGDSMEPRLYSGEIVIVGVNTPPARNGDCVVEMRDGTALVKQYRGQRDGRIFLWQYNPENQIDLDATKVKRMHAVLYRR